jgi:hypothetical protein
MNRRRMLSSVHRSIARQSAPVVGEDHSTVTRMSIADLDRIGPRLVPRQRAVCPDCFGAGEIIRADGNPNIPMPCEECHGRGYYEEKA